MRHSATRYLTSIGTCTAMLALTLATAPFATAQDQVYSHGDPTADEQYILELINRARATPAEEGVRLMDTDDQDVQMNYTYWNIDKAKTKQAFTTYPQRPPLAFHPKLIQAARGHTADMVQNNFYGHVSTNGDQLGTRYQKAGYQPEGQYGENVSGYSESVWAGHCGFNVDWGPENQIALGHRSNVMNFEGAVYTEFGAGITKTNGSIASQKVGPYVITEDFGIRSVRYILGVVYNDRNSNGFYDPGEGIPGVKIMPSRGDYHAITSTSGGYAIPFTGNGSVSVVASGGGLASPVTRTATFDGSNVKVDFVLGALPPGNVTLKLPANNATNVERHQYAYTWSRATGAESYEIHIATASNFSEAAIEINESVNDTTASFSLLKCKTKYYWRVRARGSSESSQWSPTFAFTTNGTITAAPITDDPNGSVSRGDGTMLEFQWTATSGTTTHHLRIGPSTDTSQATIEDSTLTSTSYDANVGPTGLGARMWYWKVRSMGECGWSAWSATTLFDLTVTSVDEDADTHGSQIVVAPHPLAATSRIVLPDSYRNGPVTIEVRTLAGAVIASTMRTADQAGTLSVASVVDVDALSTGTYVLTVSTSTGTTSRLVIR